MSDTVIIAMITAGGSALVAITALIAGLLLAGLPFQEPGEENRPATCKRIMAEFDKRLTRLEDKQ